VPRSQSRPSHLTALATLAAAGPLLPTLDEIAATPLAERALADRLVILAQGTLAAEQCGLLVLDDETGSIVPLAIAGVPPAIETLWRSRIAGAQLDGLLKAAQVASLRAGQAVAVRWERTPLEQCLFFGMPAAIIAPLRAGTHLIGLLGMHLDGAGPRPSRDAIALAQAVAAFAALAIDRARLLRDQLIVRSSVAHLREGRLEMEHALDHTAHEIRNPVTAISSSVQWAERRLARLAGHAAPDSEELASSLTEVCGRLRSVKDKAELLQRLALDLEDAARADVSRLELRRAPCDLFALVQTAVEDQRQAALARTIALTLPEDDMRVSVAADAARISQVLTNYLSNAIKYSPMDQPIAVTVHIEADRARVVVRDQGPGLPASEHVRVWERLYRSASVQRQTGSEDGLGLGLYISRAIVEQHGGRVGVESAQGQGCAFWFTLPLCHSRP
jgi:signal transduction histidine kinase